MEASVLSPKNYGRFYMSRGVKSLLGCLPENMGVIIQLDGPFRLTTVAASIVRCHSVVQREMPEVLRCEVLSRFSNWNERMENDKLEIEGRGICSQETG